MKYLVRAVYAAFLFGVANLVGLSGVMGRGQTALVAVFGMAFLLWVNLFPSPVIRQLRSKRLAVCAGGCELLILFLISTSLTVVYLIGCGAKWWPQQWLLGGVGSWIKHILLAVLVLAVVFWNGMIRIYLTSVQLGLKWRILGAVFGMVPIIHLFMLGKILQKVSAEVRVENDKILLNEGRKDDKICETKYPLLLVHGVFFRDFRYMNYWGRIPAQLEQNGATIFYGNHSSALSVEDSGQELRERIRQIVEETGCEKVNVIAHSKGGLDTRQALTDEETASHVASLTTINTPHRGCEFADFLLHKTGEREQQAVAAAYNSTLKKLGDAAPDFLAAVYDLTASKCAEFNKRITDAPGVFYQSVGSKCNVATGGRFPLNLSYRLVNHFDGANDGLVGESSFPWGERFQFLTVKGRRGISHGDMIDLNRENFDDFDVREFFVQLVADLKKRGF